MPGSNEMVSLTLKQRLCCLLAATETEAEKLLRTGSAGADTAAIGRRVHLRQSEIDQILTSPAAIEQARIDVNLVSQLQMQQVPGMTSERLRLVEHGKPFFSLAEFEEASGLSPDLIGELFTVASLELRDKVTRKSRYFEPVPGKYIAPPRLSFESALSVETLGFAERSPGSEHVVRVIEPDESGNSENSYQLKNMLGGQVFPVVCDQDGFERYFVPASIDIWFRPGVYRQQALTILNEAGLREITSREMVGYYQAEISSYPPDYHVLAETLRVIEKLQNFAEVDFAEPTEVGNDDFIPENEKHLPEFESASGRARTWNTDVIELTAAHVLTEGSPSVTIVVIDSGIQPDHQDLSEALYPGWESLDLNFDTGVPASELSPEELHIAHGTKVASLACGRAPGTGSRVRGVAPGCWLLPVKISGSPYGQSYGLRAAAICEAITYIPPEHRGVLNLSWSTHGEHLGIREALFKASGRGFAITTSAGNYRPGEIQRPDKLHYPSQYAFLAGDTTDDVRARKKIPGLVSVAAVNSFSRKATYSYYGANAVTVSAPGGEPGLAGMGVLVASTPETYSYEAGTSFAAPHVAGLLALLFSAKPELTAQGAVELICNTATDLDADNPDYAGMLGAGLINAKAALEQLGLSGSSPGSSDSSSSDTMSPDVMSPDTILPDTISSGASEGRLNINTATASAFRQLPLIGEWSANLIVAYREKHGLFATPDELLRTGAVDVWTMGQIRHLIVAGLSETATPSGSDNEEPAQPGQRLNINTADARQFETLPFVGHWSASQIVQYRGGHGLFSRVTDLTLTGALDQWTVSQIGHLMTVG